MGSVKSMIVEGRWPVRDLGVPPRGLAEVKSIGPMALAIVLNNSWLGMRMPIASKWS